MRKILFILFTIFNLSLCVSQDLTRVRKYIDTLTSPYLHGRGYVCKGDSLAAIYIQDRFKEYGLLPFKTKNPQHPYLQFFELDINTFPGNLELSVDNMKLAPGKDYILNPASGGGNKKLKVLFLDTAIFYDQKIQQKFSSAKTEKSAIVIDGKFFSKLEKLPPAVRNRIFSSGAIIELADKKLTASLATSQYPLPWFTVLKEKFPLNAKSINLNAEAKLIRNYSTQNVIGYVKGKNNPDTFLIITAHYDHLGRMGKEIYFPGANDNASGISMLLELAKYYSMNPPEYSIAFIAFGAEEAGLIGSEYYTKHPLSPLRKIKFLINLDLLGTGDDGITVVNATLFPDAFNLLDSINSKENYLPAVKKRGPAANSDHYHFTQKGVPCFFIYTLGGIAAYHDIFDRPETLPLTKFVEVYKLLVIFLEKL